jgi:hypothetical protein
MLHHHELSDVLQIDAKRIVRGNSNDHGTPVPKVRLRRHQNRSIRDSICKLCCCVSRAGCNHKGVEQLLRSDRFCALYRVNRASSCDCLDLFHKGLRLRKPRIQFIGML